jgi:hypothetical protein
MQNAISRIHRPFYRNGDSHRDGADVSFTDIVKMFGFKTAVIGKWVTKDEQQIAANLFFDALCDLMDILQVPEQVVSLNGHLSLGFGIGGQKHSSAHYDAQKRQLCLAKNAGGGALAHEWFHAFDHYISVKMFTDSERLCFASQLWLEDNEIIEHPINHLLNDCFKCLFLTEDGENPNPYVKQSALADKTLGCYYYAQPQEMAARAFEAIVQDHSIKNAFLVQGTKQSAEAKVGIYPDQLHRLNLAGCFLAYFERLGRSVSKNRSNQ